MDFPKEKIFCYYCRKDVTSRREMQKHLPKCRKLYKGKREMLICPVDSLHHVPPRIYDEHVRKCMEAHEQGGNLKFSFEEVREAELEINSTGKVSTKDHETVDVFGYVPDKEFDENVKYFKETPETDWLYQGESWDLKDDDVIQEAEAEVNSFRTISKVDQEHINAFSSTLHRTYQTIWGLSKEQKKEWNKAEYERIQNLKEGSSIEDIKYPRANGTYVTIGEIKAKYLNGFNESLIEPTQACSIAVSKDSFEEYPIIGDHFRSKVTEQERERRIENAAAAVDHWSSDSKRNEQIHPWNTDTSNGSPNEDMDGWIKVRSKRNKKRATSLTEGSKVKENNRYFESSYASEFPEGWRKKAEYSKFDRNVNSPKFTSPVRDFTSTTTRAWNKLEQKSKNQSMDEDSSNTFTSESSNENITNFGWCNVEKQKKLPRKRANEVSPCEENSKVLEKLNENVRPPYLTAFVERSTGARSKIRQMDKKTIDEEVSKDVSINETSNEILNTKDSKLGSSNKRRKRIRRKPKKPEVELVDPLDIEETSNNAKILNENASSADHPTNSDKDCISKQSCAKKKTQKKR